MCARVAYQAERRAVSGTGSRSNIILPRVLRIPRRGGILPLISLLGPLGGLGSLAGGVTVYISSMEDFSNPVQEGRQCKTVVRVLTAVKSQNVT